MYVVATESSAMKYSNRDRAPEPIEIFPIYYKSTWKYRNAIDQKDIAGA